MKNIKCLMGIHRWVYLVEKKPEKLDGFFFPFTGYCMCSRCYKQIKEQNLPKNVLRNKIMFSIPPRFLAKIEHKLKW